MKTSITLNKNLIEATNVETSGWKVVSFDYTNSVTDNKCHASLIANQWFVTEENYGAYLHNGIIAYIINP